MQLVLLKLRILMTLCLSLLLSETTYAKPPKQVDVVIIGAGLSGMATAYGLKKAGISYHLLELSPRVGGRVRTVRYERPGEPAIYADSGMEEYWESNPAVKILEELKLPTRSDVAVSSLVLGSRLYELGDETGAEFYQRIFTKEELAAIQNFKTLVAPLIEEIKSGKVLKPELMALKDNSFEDYVKKSKVPAKVADWIRVSIECEIGTSWSRISALDGLAEFHIFTGNKGIGEKSYRVRGGNDKFTDGMAKHIGFSNISLNKRVNRVVTVGNKVQVTYLDTSTNTNGVITAKHVVSTIPLFRLSELQFEPALSEKKRQAIQSQMWGSYFKAHLFVAPAAEKFWIKKKASILPILSDSDMGVIYDGNPDQKGKTRIVSILVTGDAAEAFNMMPLDQVRTNITQGFEKLWPGFGKEIKGIEFYRYHPRAIAAWPVGRSRYDELSNEIRKPEHRVYLAGDFTESSHSDGAFLSAARVVKQIQANNK